MFFETSFDRTRWFTFDPVTASLIVKLRIEEILASESKQNANWGNDTKEHNTEDKWANDTMQKFAKL